jgi:hypothetical protein
MTRQKFLQSLDELLDLPEGTLSGGESLGDLEQWNSMAMIGFIALANSHDSSVKLGPRQIASCESVAALLQLAKVDGTSS